MNGIEPSPSVWKTDVLPLYDTRMFLLVRLKGIEPLWIAPLDFESSVYASFTTVVCFN